MKLAMLTPADRSVTDIGLLPHPTFPVRITWVDGFALLGLNLSKSQDADEIAEAGKILSEMSKLNETLDYSPSGFGQAMIAAGHREVALVDSEVRDLKRLKDKKQPWFHAEGNPTIRVQADDMTSAKEAMVIRFARAAAADPSEYALELSAWLGNGQKIIQDKDQDTEYVSLIVAE